MSTGRAHPQVPERVQEGCTLCYSSITSPTECKDLRSKKHKNSGDSDNPGQPSASE